jgi:hypothetical protein
VIVTIRETTNGRTVVFTFCEKHPQLDDDWGRVGPCNPQYFMILGRRIYRLCNSSEAFRVADDVTLLIFAETLAKYAKWVVR